MEAHIDEKGIVTFYDKIVSKVTNLENFLKTFEDQKPLNSGILPRGCISYIKKGRSTIFVMEEKPGIKRVNYRTPEHLTATNMPLSTPFLYWILVFSPSLQVYCRASKTPIKDLSDKVLLPPLLNIHGQGASYVCAGDGIQVDAKSNYIDKIDQFYNTLWTSVWNHDITPALPIECKSFYDYIQKSSVDPTFWAKATYHPSPSSISQLLLELTQHERQ